MFQTYQPSGRVSPSFMIWLLVALLVTIVLAYVYQLGLTWIPSVYISFLLTMGLGTAIGTVCSRVIHWGKIRNIPAGILCLLVISVIGLSAKFGFQYLAARERIKDELAAMNVADLSAQFEDGREVTPEQLKELQQQIVKEYTFAQHLKERVNAGWVFGRRAKGAPVAGWFVPLVWLTEAGTVLFIAGPLVMATLKRPFSEKLGMWADEIETVLLLPVTDQEMVDKINGAQSVQELLELPIPKSDKSEQVAAYTVHSVPNSESEDAYLSVELQSSSVNAKGETVVKKTSLVNLAIITASQRELLRSNAEILNEAFEAYHASLEQEGKDLEEDGAKED